MRAPHNAAALLLAAARVDPTLRSAAEQVQDALIALDAEVRGGQSRLARIANAHQKHVDALGGTDGECRECRDFWPCPTYVWATTDRASTDPWNPRDDEVTG